MRTRIIFHTTLLLALAVSGCNRPPAAPPPTEKIVNVTVAAAEQRDLPMTASAVGAETAITAALGYDPTHGSGGTTYIRLPFSEATAAQLKIGQAVTLSNFSNPEHTARGTIRAIRPALNAMTLSREVIVAVPASRDWRPIGSVRGEVVTGVRAKALIVPEQAAVLRPAGTVVYIVENDHVQERRVQTGIVRDGKIEITSGLVATDTVVVDGASLLSDKARIKVREPAS